MKTPFFLRSLIITVVAIQISFFPLVQAQQLSNIDVSGQKGEDGKHGTSYDGEASRQTTGRDGENATEATAGKNAGSIDIKLKQSGNPLEGQLVLEGVAKTTSGESKKSVQLNIGDNGYIHLVAKGGKGGDGGNGGNGERGGKGRDGSDATRYSSGDNGGTGSTGGTAGEATDGKKGGDGGQIRLRVHADETHLAMLVKSDVTGASGGKAGTPGTPGSGGPGGDGGSSYSWTEQESRTRSVPDGKGGTTIETYYETTHHSNPGGSSGPKGSDGRRASKTPTAGADGKDGRFIIEVDEGSGKTSEYKSVFDIEILNYDLKPLDQNDIYEPNRKVEVRGIRIRNRGGMPTPSKMVVLVTLAHADWVVAEPIKLELPFSLQPGQEIVLDKPLRFTVKDVVINKSGARFTERSATRVDAFQTGANRYFTGAKEMPFQITFPVEITPITVLRSVAPGEASHIIWEVKNISNRDFGSETELKRQIITDLNLAGGDLPADQLEILDENGNRFENSNPFARAILSLGPKGSGRDTAIVRAIVKVKPEAAENVHRSHKLQTRLALSDENGKFRDVQFHEQEIRVLQYFNSKEQLDWLVVINNDTTREEVDAWKKLARSRGKRLDVWDLSSYGVLDLQSRILDNKSLADLLGGKLVILLNNSFDPGIGSTKGQFFLAQKDFLLSASTKGINFYIPGQFSEDRSENILERLLVPHGDILINEHGNQKQFFNYVRDSWDSFRKGQRGKNEVSMDETHVITEEDFLSIKGSDVRFRHFVEGFSYFFATRFMVWGKPSEKYIKKIAEKTGNLLNFYFPNRKFVVTYEFDPQLKQESNFLFFKKWNLGRIEVRRTNDKNLGAAVVLDVKDDKLHSQDFVLGKENFAALGLSENFESLTREFIDYLKDKTWVDLPETEKHERALLLADVLLSHIVDDQIMLRTQKMKGEAQDIEFEMKKMRYLKEALHESSEELVRNSLITPAKKNVFIHFMSNIETFEATQMSWWQKGVSLFVTSQNDATGKISKKLRLAMMSSLLSEEEISSKNGEYKKTVLQKIQNFKKDYKTQKSLSRPELGQKRAALQSNKSITSQTELTRVGQNLVMPRARYNEIRTREQEAARAQQNLSASIHAQRDQLTVKPGANTCATLFN
ncbi:MAG: hypothetical protein V4596_04780 [Bdellovibrionota bacterium]